MTKKRTSLERAAGKLILAVQQQWDAELGEPGAVFSEEAMHNCHSLLGAAKDGTLDELLRGASVTDFIGRSWVRAHVAVVPAIQAFEAEMQQVRYAHQTASANRSASDKAES